MKMIYSPGVLVVGWRIQSILVHTMHGRHKQKAYRHHRYRNMCKGMTKVVMGHFIVIKLLIVISHHPRNLHLNEWILPIRKMTPDEQIQQINFIGKIITSSVLQRDEET